MRIPAADPAPTDDFPTSNPKECTEHRGVGWGPTLMGSGEAPKGMTETTRWSPKTVSMKHLPEALYSTTPPRRMHLSVLAHVDSGSGLPVGFSKKLPELSEPPGTGPGPKPPGTRDCRISSIGRAAFQIVFFARFSGLGWPAETWLKGLIKSRCRTPATALQLSAFLSLY